MTHSRAGQSFVELLIAITIGAIFMVGAAMIIAPSLSVNGQAAKVQVASTNAASLLNNVRVWSEGSWQNILSIATGTGYQYYVITSSSPYTVTSGIESLNLATTTYTRYFYISDAYRDASGNPTTASSGGSVYDPSTKQISVVYNWTGGKASTISTYITRNGDAAFDQTDWSGGASSTAVATSVNNQFGTSSNIDYSTTTGSIYVSIPGY
jgi:hypothetical protein